MKNTKSGTNNEISTKGKKYQRKFPNFTKMAALIPGHPVQKNCNPLPSLQSCIPSSKYLFYLVLWDLFDKFILSVFGGI